MEDWARKRYPVVGAGPTLGVKDIIDVLGEVNTAGSKLLWERREPAAANAPVVQRALESGAQLRALTVLVELAYGAQGINPHFGTPTNPLSPELIPGGSSSGSAVGVAMGEIDVGYGTDTGGSVRIPAACCGVFGLKTTWGRISTQGVYPLSQFLDTVGPLGATLDAVALGLRWMGEVDESAFDRPFSRVSSVRTSDSLVLEETIVSSLDASMLNHRRITLRANMEEAWQAGTSIMGYEAWRNNLELTKDLDRIDPKVAQRLVTGSSVTDGAYVEAKGYREVFLSGLAEVFADDGILALSTIPFAIPTLSHAYDQWLNINTLPFNLAGLPSLTIPLSTRAVRRAMEKLGSTGDFGQGMTSSGDFIPVAVQLVGPPNSEERLISTARVVLASQDS